ncbi:MAG: AEC family transporter [Myxococcota bacterium]
MILQILSILAPILVSAAIGFAWARRGGSYDAQLATALIMNVGAPCLVFAEISSLELDGVALLEMVAGAVLSMAIFVLVGALALRAARLPAHTFLSPLVFANTGNMGLPLCLFSFGREGLALATAIFATVSIAHYTVGVWIWTGRASLRELLRMPLSYAVVLASLVLVRGWSVPAWIHDTTALLGGLTIPLMLLTLGVSLSGLKLNSVGRSLSLATLRLAMGFATGVGLAALLGLEGTARGVLILQCSMPAAVFNYIFAQRFDRSPDEVANLVIVSTLMAFALLPALLASLL